MVKYMVRLMMSWVMVPIGPLALAGSRFILLNRYGIISPVINDDRTVAKSAIPRMAARVNS